MKRKLRERIDLGAIAFVVLLLAVYLVWSQGRERKTEDRYTEQISVLSTEIKVREQRIDFISEEAMRYKDSITTQKSVIDSLNRVYAALLRQKEISISEAEEVPADSSYELLQVIYPDTSEVRPFALSGNQVRLIYVASIESGYLEQQIVSLDTSLAVRDRQIALQDSLITQSSLAIGEYELLSGNFRETISIKDKIITGKDKKIRRTKIAGVTIGGCALVLGILIGN